MKSLYSLLKDQKQQVIGVFSNIGKDAVCNLISHDQTQFPWDIYDVNYKSIIFLTNVDKEFSMESEHVSLNRNGSRISIEVPKWVIHTKEVSSMLNWNGYTPETDSELALLIDSIDEDTVVSFDNTYLLAIDNEPLNPEVTWPKMLKHYQVKASAPLWHSRELKRLDNGTYQPLPKQALNLLTQEQIETIMQYFPHLSTKDESLISYTATPEKGEADIQTPIKPGRFLAKVLPNVDNELVKSFAAVFSSTRGIRLVVEKSPEAFSYAYMNLKNSGSCMDGRKNFSSCIVDGVNVHPSVAYYHPDNELHILYAVNSEGTVIARCIGNASEMKHTRVYFDKRVSKAENKMILLLKEARFEYDEDCLLGVKISKLTTDLGAIICPYIDPGNAGVEIHSDHLVVGGGVEANSDTGLLNEVEYIAFCDCCGEGIEDGDETYFTYEEETVCSSCCANRYTTAFDLRELHYTYVRDNSSSIYTLSGMLKLPYGYKLYDGDSVVEVQACNELVHLDQEFYNSHLVAHFENCYTNSLGRGVLVDDMDRFGVFYNYDVEDICEIDRWIILDGELKEIWPGHDLDEYELDFSSSGHDYPMLRCYKTK